MSRSIGSDTLAAFMDKVGGPGPVPAGVAISAVSASLALALVPKILQIASRKKGTDTAAPLLDAARRESEHLAQLADEDVRAFEHYMECVRRKESTQAALREAI